MSAAPVMCRRHVVAIPFNTESYEMWKLSQSADMNLWESSLSTPMYHPNIRHDRLSITVQSLNMESWCLSQYFRTSPPQYAAGALHAELHCSVPLLSSISSVRVELILAGNTKVTRIRAYMKALAVSGKWENTWKISVTTAAFSVKA